MSALLRQCGVQMVRRRQILLTHTAFRAVAFAGQESDAVNPPGQVRHYKRFGHEKEYTPRISKLFHLFIGTIFFATIIDWSKVKRWLTPKVDADEGVEAPGVEDKPPKNVKNSIKDDSSSDDESDDQSDDQLDDDKKKAKKEKVGFRERKIVEYENRVRQFSTPDKIFRYFATVRLSSPSGTEVCMTPDDFLRSIVPGLKQPEGLGLDQYRRYDPKSVSENLNLRLEKNSIFYKLGSYGLITFSDYIFLLTVLSTSRRHFEIAFQMFDLNGDGDVDCEEFNLVATLLRQQSSFGSRHRDHGNTGNTFKGVNSALTTYFFGSKCDKKLTIEKFLKFQQQLQREMLSLEFERKHPENGIITETDFAELLLVYAGYPLKKKAKKLKHVKKRFRDSGKGISKNDYLDFFHFLSNITDVDTALTFYHIAGASIDQVTLKHVAKTVAMVDLSDHVIDVVFTIFDDNNDNQLSNREFVAVLKNRVQRGLEKPKDTGFIKLLRSMLKCAKETKPVLLNI